MLLKYYSVLQSTTPVLLCTTKCYSSTTLYYTVLLQHYSVLQSTTQVLLCTTKYYSSTTLYYKVLIQYYSVLQSTTPVLLCTTQCYSSTTLYYTVLLKYYTVLPQYYTVLLQYYSVLQSTTPVLLCTTKYYKVLLQYYSVLQSTNPVVLCTTKYYSSTTLYYKVLIQYYSKVLLRYYSVLQSTTPVLVCTTKYLLNALSHMKRYLQCAEEQESASNFSKYILRLPRKMTLMINPLHTWNAIYNARTNKCHCPNSPNTAPATKNESHDWSLSHMKRYLQCAEQQVSLSKLTKYCACHEKWISWLILVTHETLFTMRGLTSVIVQTHQILRLPRKMNLMIDPCHTWNAIYNARSNKCHCPNSPNTAPATKNESHDWSLSHMKRYLQCAE